MSENTTRAGLLSYIPGICAALMILTGALVLSGWAFDIPTLTTLYPGFASMKANTAICFLLSGIVLGIAAFQKQEQSMGMTISVACEIAILAMAGLTLFEYLSTKKLGIDQVFFRDPVRSLENPHPGRMSPITTLGFILVATALLLSTAKIRFKHHLLVRESLALLLMSIGALSIAGHLSGVSTGAFWWNISGVAVHTSVLFLVTGMGLMCATLAEDGPMWSILKLTTAGFVFALLMMLAICVFLYRGMSNLIIADNSNSQNNQVIADIRKTVSDVDEIQTAVRGFVITGQENSLTPFDKAAKRLVTDQENLRELVKNDADQIRRLDQVGALMVQRLGFWQQIIAIRRQRGFEAAAELIATGRGQELTDQIRAILQQMEERESRALEQNSARATRAIDWVFMVSSTGTLASVFVLALVFFALNGEATARIGAQATLEAQAVTLKNTNTQLESTLDQLRAKTDALMGMTQQLWQTSKLATMGELAASIAHELNNPLAIVSLRLETLVLALAADDPQHKSFEVISNELDRMGRLISNLLEFSRRSHPQTSTLDIRNEVDSAVDLIHYHLRKRQIEVVRDFAVDVPTINADRQQLRQVFLNLITNASDAMTKGGTITIRVANSMLNDKPAIAVEFSDTGEGIETAVLKRIWEPFFTTKPEGKGTGLGMGICKRTVEDHNGIIDITSEVGKGTTVRVVLPLNGSTPIEM